MWARRFALQLRPAGRCGRAGRVEQVLDVAYAGDPPCPGLDARDVLLAVDHPAQEHDTVLGIHADPALAGHARAAEELALDLVRERDVVDRVPATVARVQGAAGDSDGV